MEHKRPTTTFQRYLASLGDQKASEMLGVPRRTIKSWRLGDRAPRPTQAREITDRIPVTLNDIYGPESVGA